MSRQVIYPYETIQGSLSQNQLIQCCSRKEASLKKILNLSKNEREKMIKDMSPIIPDIFNLWDNIEKNFADISNKNGKRYGSRKYSKYNVEKIIDYALFSKDGLSYSIPKGIMYPMVAAFRALVKVDKKTNQYSWTKNPLETWNKLGNKLVTIVLDEKVDSPEYLGKNINLWNNLFKEVYIYNFKSK